GSQNTSRAPLPLRVIPCPCGRAWPSPEDRSCSGRSSRRLRILLRQERCPGRSVSLIRPQGFLEIRLCRGEIEQGLREAIVRLRQGRLHFEQIAQENIALAVSVGGDP